MGAVWSLFAKKEERQRVTAANKIGNIVSNNFRGLVGFILAVIILAVLVDHNERSKTVAAIWLFLTVFLLFNSAPIGACGLIPLFAMPMLGILESATCCASLMNENIILFFIGGWLLYLLNNCGMDKRIACYFLTRGGKDSYTPAKLLLKTSMAAFCTSALSERELATQAIMNYVMSAFQPLLNVNNEVNYLEVRKIICNALAISSSIGSFCIVHSSIITLQMRSLFSDATDAGMEFPDVFNFLNYSVYAVPTALVMFIFNLAFQTFLISRYSGSKPMSPVSKEVLQKAFKKQQTDMGPVTNHQMISTFFYVVLMCCYFTRWSKWLGMGWATFRQNSISPELCGIKDATTASIFIILLHFLPKSLNFLKIFSVKKQRDMPVMKIESGILFWKFIDKNTDYSLFLLIGTGTIIYKAMVLTNLNGGIADVFGTTITGLNWNAGVFIVVFVAVFGGTIMAGVSAQACLMPLVLGMAMTGQNQWPQRQYLAALAVGLGCGLGFCFPFYHTPAAYVRSIGKVEGKKQLFYSIGSTIICMVILWLSLCFYAPILWDPNDVGIIPQPRGGLVAGTTTVTADVPVTDAAVTEAPAA